MKKQAFEVLPNSSRLVGAALKVIERDKVESVSVFESVRCEEHIGRVLVVVEHVSSLSGSSVNNYRYERCGHERFALNLRKADRIEIDGLKFDIDLRDSDFGREGVELNVISFNSVPLIGRRAHSEEQEKILQRSSLLIVYLIFCDKQHTELCALRNSYIFESYNHLGFVVVEKKSFNDFVVSRLGGGIHNLVDAFTSTELAGELFDAGLMILCWGITPWTYMITSCAEGGREQFFPRDVSPICSGKYVFSKSIRDVSVIPGVALLNWDTNREDDWPSLIIEGYGGVVELDLYVVKTVDEETGEFFPIPYFNIMRKEIYIDESMPILNCDIIGGS